MPISFEQFKFLGDYSDLEQLHVYGDLLRLYSLPVHGKIAETATLFRRIRSLDERILTVYVSYILAQVGFYAQALASGVLPPRLYTTEFKDNDWLRNLDFFEHVEEGYRDDWAMYYENEKNETTRILFVTSLPSDEDPVTGEYDEATHLLKLFDQSVSNYVIVHPRLSRRLKQTFMKTKEAMKKKTGEDFVLSTGEFTSKFIPDEAKRKIVEANWEVLREKILGKLQEEWPILIYSIHDKQISEIRARLRKARLKYELGTDLENSIKDAGISCEGFFRYFTQSTPRRLIRRWNFLIYSVT